MANTSQNKKFEKDVFNAIILGYRTVIDERYSYNKLKKDYHLPKAIDENLVNEIKYFFLNYIYPDLEKREELNAAFKTLDKNLKQPEKLFSLLKESFKLVLKHGRHLPKIVSAGFKALRSYRSATQFENTLVREAINQDKKPPYSSASINALIATLSREEIEQFIESTESLFQIMYDKVLVQKIKDVLTYLIERMQSKPKLFSPEEVQGLEIGLEMITRGDEVLNSLSKKNQEVLIQFIVKVEHDNLDKLFL